MIPRNAKLLVLLCFASILSFGQAATLMPVPRQWFPDANGLPLSGGKIFTFAAGTSTPLAAYTDSTAATPLSNPVILDSGGFATIFLGASPYKIVAQNSLGVQQWSVDNVSGPLSISGSNVFSGNNTFSGTNTFSGNVTFSGVNSPKNEGSIRYASAFAGADCGAKIAAADADFANPKGEIWINRACGMTISTWVSPQHSLRWIEGGEWSVSATMLFSHGGIEILGLGLADNGTTSPGTRLIWSGALNQDLMQWTGSSQRNDKIVMKDIILDGGNIARYALRIEKTDTSSIYDSRIRNAVTSNYYQVNTTGQSWYNVDIAAINNIGAIIDWGSGSFNCYKCQFDQETPTGSTGPFLVIQGASNSISFNGVEMDALHLAFVGHILVTGFLTNSAYPGAPTGGAGSPTVVTFNNLSTFYDNGDVTVPSQGADILVTGASAGNVSQNVTFNNCYISASALGSIAFKADNTLGMQIQNTLSTGHTQGLASTIIATGNATGTVMFNVNNGTDTNRISSGMVYDVQFSPTGSMTINGNLKMTGGVNSLLSIGHGNGDPTATSTGALFGRDDLSRLRFWDGAVWRSTASLDGTDSLTNKTFTDQIRSTLATGTAPLTVTSTTPVANLTSSSTTYNAAGTQQVGTHDVIDTCTLGTNCAVTLVGSAAFSGATTYKCWAADASATNAVRVNQITGATVTFTGTGTDVIVWGCKGN